MRTMTKTKRTPWTGLEWGVFIAAAALAACFLLGFRLIGLGDALRFARSLVRDSIYTVIGMLRDLGRFLRDLF